MTDNDIIKALEESTAEHLAIYMNCHTRNGTVLVSPAEILDLINRQKEEIEKLKDMLKLYRKYNPPFIKHIKAEAVKEFAADVINDILPKYMQGHSEQALKISLAISERAKEMAGEN